MKQITAVIDGHNQHARKHVYDALMQVPLVGKIFVIGSDVCDVPAGGKIIDPAQRGPEGTMDQIVRYLDSPYLLIVSPCNDIALGPRSLERFVDVAETVKAGMVYADYYETARDGMRAHPVNDYQPGSIGEDFEFGPMALFSRDAIRRSCAAYGPPPAFFPACLYDLRLKVSVGHPVFHIREFLYRVAEPDEDAQGRQFSYQDPRNRPVQEELERIATDHLKRIGAFLEPVFEPAPPSNQVFPVEASVIIPVRNRARTIADAVESALSQETDFPFNVLVVDNHSSDGTTDLLAELAQEHERLRPIVPVRRDLNIGGCWNEAIYSEHCGRFAIQLDSDDLYSAPSVLQRIVAMLRDDRCAMVIGSYMLVNSALEPIPPGLIDHREWTEANGPNNALRVNGFGAPRAFNTAVLRRFGFLNVSYGEDYAIALRLSRQYRIGRIYDNLYLCRRWEGNSDAALSIEQKNRYDAFKDQVRTLEIGARQRMNQV